MAIPGRIQGFTTGLTDIDTTPQEALGAIRMAFNADYKYVAFNGTLSCVAGDFMCYQAPPSDPDLFSVLQTVDTTTTALPAGVAAAAHPAGGRTYGWIQITGTARLSITPSGTPTVGANLTSVGAAGVKQLALVTAVTQAVAGVYLGTDSGAVAPYLLLKCTH
jgi:hypothetical protein